MRTLFLLALLLPLACVTQAATVYRSVGPDGQIIYSDKPPADGTIEKTLSLVDLPSTPMPESVLRYRDELQKSMKKRLSEVGMRLDTSEPVIFTAVWCGYCTRAKSYLAEKRIRYQEYDIDTPNGMRAYVEAGGGRGVPVMLWNNQKVQGFSPPAYDALFKNLP
jgi:glutaredoxin